MFPPVTDRWLTSLVTLSFVCAAASALAEQGDRDKPIQIEADRASLDQLKGVTVYEGNVVVTQGTILLRAAQVTVTQDKNGGGDVAVARGNPATFRQKRDRVDEFVEAEADDREVQPPHRHDEEGRCDVKRAHPPPPPSEEVPL